MTREEAIHKWVLPALQRIWNEKRVEEILKALEQKPDAIHNEREQAYMKGYEDASKRYRKEPCMASVECEDCISRQAMHMELEKWITYGEYKYSNAMRYLFDRIDRLPAVTPKQKMGYWRHYEGMLYCSKCGAEFYDEIMEHCGDDVPKYCPDCGQPKMFEPQESEEE